MRVVSLLPSATEILYALGIEPVGVSHECDFPPKVREKTQVVSSRVENSGKSTDINQQVEDALDQGGVYKLDAEKIEELNPDLIITQGVCDMCAVDDQTVRETVDSMKITPDIISLHPHTLEDILENIREVGEATGTQERADEVVEQLRDRIDNIRESIQDTENRPRVVILDWMDPIMVAGHWVPEMVEIAGGRYGMEERGAVSRRRDWGEILEYAPEVIIAAPCGFTLRQTVVNFNELDEREGWEELPAVQNRRAHAMDGHNYMNRPGPRIVDSLEFLAQILHPDLFGNPPADVVQTPVRIR